MSRSNGIEVVHTYRGQSFAQGIACLWPSGHMALAPWDWKIKRPIVKYGKKEQTNLSCNKILCFLTCWILVSAWCCVVAVESGHWWETSVHVSSHHWMWRIVLNGKQTHITVSGGVLKKCCAVNIQGPGGKSHQVTVRRRLQAAVAARLCLVGCGCSQCTFIALLVQPIYSVPDVGRIARPL